MYILMNITSQGGYPNILKATCGDRWLWIFFQLAPNQSTGGGKN